MNTVLFSVANLEHLNEVLGSIRRLLKTFAVEPLYPDSKRPELAREFYVELGRGRDPEETARLLREVPGVVDVEVPAPRKLIA